MRSTQTSAWWYTCQPKSQATTQQGLHAFWFSSEQRYVAILPDLLCFERLHPVIVISRHGKERDALPGLACLIAQLSLHFFETCRHGCLLEAEPAGCLGQCTAVADSSSYRPGLLAPGVDLAR